jgi:hypothetical protein
MTELAVWPVSPALGRYASGVVADGVRDNQAALQQVINDANASVAGFGPMVTARVLLPPGHVKTGPLILPGNVELAHSGTRLTAIAAGPLITVQGSYNRIAPGLQLSGGGIGVGAAGIAFASGSRWSSVGFCRFDQFAGRAIWLQTGSVAHWIEKCYAQNCLLDTGALSDFTGVLDINGNDHFIARGEYTGSRASLSSANRWVCAVAVREPNHFLTDVVGEIADTGFYIASGASFLRFANCRADLNRGHGWHFDGGSGSLVGCHAINNGQETHNTYDGFSTLTSGTNFQFSGCFAESNTTNRHRYGFQDQTNSGSNFNVYDGCRSRGHSSGAFFTFQFTGSQVDQPDNPPYGLPAANATPNVEGFRNWFAQNVGAFNVTNFTTGRGGQRISVIGDGFTTVVNGATIKTTTGANKLLAANRVYDFILSNGVWIEVGP